MNQYSRIEDLIGKDNLDKIHNSKVLVLGIGGVGASALVTLARNGVKNIIIVDNDVIDITNINRQCITFNSNVGKKKVNVAKKYIENIDSDINITIIDKFIDNSNIDELFKLKFDYLIDACDTINTKKLIIKKCIQHNKVFVSCMGTAKKINPEKLKITTLDKTEYDPIAKILRNWIKKEKISKKIYVVSSNEEVINKKCENIPSMSFVPNVAGILCAKYIIDKIVNFKNI